MECILICISLLAFVSLVHHVYSLSLFLGLVSGIKGLLTLRFTPIFFLSHFPPTSNLPPFCLSMDPPASSDAHSSLEGIPLHPVMCQVLLRERTNLARRLVNQGIQFNSAHKMADQVLGLCLSGYCPPSYPRRHRACLRWLSRAPRRGRKHRPAGAFWASKSHHSVCGPKRMFLHFSTCNMPIIISSAKLQDLSCDSGQHRQENFCYCICCSAYSAVLRSFPDSLLATLLSLATILHRPSTWSLLYLWYVILVLSSRVLNSFGCNFGCNLDCI